MEAGNGTTETDGLLQTRRLTRKKPNGMLPVMRTFNLSVLDVHNVQSTVTEMHNRYSRKSHGWCYLSCRRRQALPDFATLLFTSRGTAHDARNCWFWFELAFLITFLVMTILSGEYGMRATTFDFAPREHCGQQGSWHRSFFAFGCLAVGSVFASSSITHCPRETESSAEDNQLEEKQQEKNGKSKLETFEEEAA